MAAVVSLALGMINTLPFAPLDGHRIAVDAVDTLFGERGGDLVWRFAKTGGVVLVVGELVFFGWLLFA